MKTWAINLLLLAAVISAIWLFTVKFEKPADQDVLKTGLAGIEKHLSPGSYISFKTNAPFEALNMLYANYFLGPVHLVRFGEKQYDTTLLLLQASMIDSANAAFIKSSSILWTNKDDHYQYYLVHH